MTARNNFRYNNRTLKSGELSQALDAMLKTLGYSESEVKFWIFQRLADGTSVSNSSVTLDDLNSICDLETYGVSFFNNTLGSNKIYVHFGSFHPGVLRIQVDAPSVKVLNDIKESLEKSLELEKLSENDEEIDEKALLDEDLAQIQKRLDNLEDAVYPPTRRLRCFFSYRFSGDNEILALRVQQFLTLLDVEVLSGATYEPRQISEKVFSKLRQPLDFVVLMVTADGESMWTRDEASAALHKGITLVPLIQKGIAFESGLFGDVELVEFEEGHIGDAFLKLLQAITFVREQEFTAASLAALEHESSSANGDDLKEPV